MNRKNGADHVIALRALMEEKFPEAHRRMASAGRAGVCAAAGLEGLGIVEGSVVEIVARGPSRGAGLLLLRVLEGWIRERRRVALVDGRDGFDAANLAEEDRDWVLWVRCRGAEQAVQAADLLLRDGNLEAVVLDLQLNPERELRRLPSSVWHRLRALAEASGRTLFGFTPCRLIGSAAVRVEMESRYTAAVFDLPRETLGRELRFEVFRRRWGGGSGMGAEERAVLFG